MAPWNWNPLKTSRLYVELMGLNPLKTSRHFVQLMVIPWKQKYSMGPVQNGRKNVFEIFQLFLKVLKLFEFRRGDLCMTANSNFVSLAHS